MKAIFTSLGILSFIGCVVLLFNVAGCNYRNVETIKQYSQTALEAQGFKIVGYQGYQIGDFETPGGKVWYWVTKSDNTNTLYECCVSKWGNEYHIYQLHALNAFTPTKN